MLQAPIKSMEEFRRQYILRDQIGTGSYGIVHIMENINTNSRTAGKFIRKTKPHGNGRIRKEIKILAILDHKNVLEYVESYSSPDCFAIVTNYYRGGNLYERREREERNIIGYVRQICEGLQYLHKNKVVHRDIKPSNIVFEDEEHTHIRIIDFGSACFLNDEYSRGFQGTRSYMAPEVYLNVSVTGATDMWSLGVTTFFLLSFTHPFPKYEDRKKIVKKVQFTYSSAFKRFSAEARMFIDNLLVRQPEQRLTASSALQHVWLRHPDQVNSPSTSTSE